MSNSYYRLREMFSKIPRSILLALLFGAIILTPYPETITGNITIVTSENQDACAIGLLPLCFFEKVKRGMHVKLELDGFNSKESATKNGFINYINREQEETAEGSFFSFVIMLRSNPFMHKGMKGKIIITLPDKNLLMRGIALVFPQ